MTAISTTDSNFETDVIKSTLPVIIDFWADWCGPCKQISPMLEEISVAKKNEVLVIKLNIDENPLTPQKYGVRGIPTLMFFNKGKLIDSKVGSMPKLVLDEWIEFCLNQ